MAIYDISLPVRSGMAVWPGDPPVEVKRLASIAEGSDANVSHLACGVHAGTHVDAPLHFLDGAPSVEALPLDVLTGPAYVAHLPQASVIDAETLEGAAIPKDASRVLLKTRNGRLWDESPDEFREGFIAVNASGAAWLVDRGVRLIGVDYLSVAPFGEAVETHHILLEAGVVIIEGVDLRQVPPGKYDLCCLPLKLVGSDGAPARAILVSPSSGV